MFPLFHRDGTQIVPSLLSQATSSNEQIEEWLKLYSGCTWAAATGSDSGIFVLEVARTVDEYLLDDLTSIDTLQFDTYERVKMFFQWPVDGFPAYQRRRLGKGIYLRQSGDYVELDNARDCFFDVPLAPISKAPAELLNSIRAPQPKPQPKPAGVITFPLPVPVAPAPQCILVMAFTKDGGGWTCDFFSPPDLAKSVKRLVFPSDSSIRVIASQGGSYSKGKLLDSMLKYGRGNIVITLAKQQWDTISTIRNEKGMMVLAVTPQQLDNILRAA